jgi:hypothetical protein
MLKLGLAPSGWLTLLPGVRVRFDPVSRPMVRAGRRAAAAFLADNQEPELEDEQRARAPATPSPLR